VIEDVCVFQQAKPIHPKNQSILKQPNKMVKAISNMIWRMTRTKGGKTSKKDG
jgi:hypothetical protein